MLDNKNLAELTQHHTSENTITSLNVVSLQTLLTDKLPSREAMLAPWLTSQSLNMIYAPRGIGKTFMALNIAYAVSIGGRFLHWRADKPRGVLLLDGEMPATLLQQRLRDIVACHPKPSISPRLDIITLDYQTQGMPDLATMLGQQQVAPAISEDIELVIVDNLSTLVRSGRENEAESWAPIQQWALQLRAQHKSVLFIHHAGRNGQARGTSRREDVLDTIISLQHPENYQARMGACFVVEFMKARHLHGEALQPFVAQLITQHGKSTWQTQAYQGSTYEQVIELANQGASQAEIVKQQGFSKATVYRHYHKGRAEGRIHT
jgi:hypothetical protein